MRIPGRLIVVAAALLGLAAPAAAKDALTIGVSQYPTSLHPAIATHVVLSFVHGMTRRPFTVYDPDWKLVCLLCVELPDRAKGTARDWTTPDGKPGLATDYAIRSDARWGDGTPVTTRDVLFTWKLGRVPEAGFAGQETFRRMEQVIAHDDRRFTVHWNKRTCDYQGLGDFELIPAHVEAKAAAAPQTYSTQNGYDRDPTNPGLYNGPYRIVAVQPGASITLEPNAQWQGQAPYFKRITVRTIENTAALEQNLLAGEIDMISGEDGISLDQALSLEGRKDPRFDIVFRTGLFYEHIDLNLDNPLLADRRLRRSLLMAIDREAISQRLFAGKQPVAHGQVHPDDRHYWADAPKTPYDSKAAKLLLVEAGWTQGPDGFLRTPQGERATLELLTTAGNRTRELVAQVLQSNWRTLGIDVRLRGEPARVMFGQSVRERRFPGMVMFAFFSSPGNVPRSTLHSSMVPDAANNWSGQNYTGYRSAEMDEAIDRVETDCAPADQTRLWQTIQRLYAEELPVLPLYFRANAFVLPRWLKGVTPTGHQFPSTLWVEHWTGR